MKETFRLLEKAIGIAYHAHKDKTDKAGVPYILHPLRVMNDLEDIEDKIVGVLHDTVEDTYVTEDLLIREGFPTHLINAVMSVTRFQGETYKEFIQRAKKNPIGRRVKIADMRDNSDLFRMHDLPDKHLKMIKKYHSAIKELEPNHNNRLKV
jgi:(p)ppGpp synthase/HD superfamily hydrolase